MVVTGVRWAESTNRRNTHGVANVQGKPKTTRKLADDMGAEYKLNKHGEVIMNDDNDANRRMVEQCYRTQKTMVNPIVDWTDEDVWGFLNENGIPHCSLYDEGYKRLGCIGCPLAGTREMLRDFERYPKYKENYIRAFQRMIDNHPGQIRILDPEAETKFKLDVEAVGPENIGGELAPSEARLRAQAQERSDKTRPKPATKAEPTGAGRYSELGQRVPLTMPTPPRSMAQKYTGGGIPNRAYFRNADEAMGWYLHGWSL